MRHAKQLDWHQMFGSGERLSQPLSPPPPPLSYCLLKNPKEEHFFGVLKQLVVSGLFSARRSIEHAKAHALPQSLILENLKNLAMVLGLHLLIDTVVLSGLKVPTFFFILLRWLVIQAAFRAI